MKQSLTTICLLAAASPLLANAIDAETDGEGVIDSQETGFGVDWNWYNRGGDWSQYATCIAGTM